MKQKDIILHTTDEYLLQSYPLFYREDQFFFFFFQDNFHLDLGSKSQVKSHLQWITQYLFT